MFHRMHKPWTTWALTSVIGLGVVLLVLGFVPQAALQDQAPVITPTPTLDPALESVTHAAETVAAIMAENARPTVDRQGTFAAMDQMATTRAATPAPREEPEIGGGTGRILYSLDDGNNTSFYLFDLRDGTTNKLKLPAHSVGAQWVTDGYHLIIRKWIIYAPCVGQGPDAESTPAPCVGVFNVLSSSETLVPTLPRTVGLALSPNQSQWAFIYEDSNDKWQIWAANFDGTNQRQLTSYPTGVDASGGITWTPDGRFITYALRDGRQVNIRLITPDGTNDHILIENGMSPAWSPDGTTLAYVAEDLIGNNDSRYVTYIAAADADGTNIRGLTLNNEPLQRDYDPAWSPDGQFIAFARFNELYVMRADGTDSRLITRLQSAGVRNLSWQLPISTEGIAPTPSATPTATASATPTPGPTFDPANPFSPVDQTGHASVQLRASPEEYIGQGYGDAEGRINLEGSARFITSDGSLGIRFVADGESQDNAWMFFFNIKELELGRTYETEAKYHYYGKENSPAMDIRSPGRGCGSLSGQFTIEQVTPEVVISFTQFCERNPDWKLSGTVTFQPN